MNIVSQYTDEQMILIPGGRIEMRDDRIKTNCMVQVDPFLMAKTQVTEALYTAVTKKVPYVFDADQKPIVNISWNEAVAFCNLFSKEAGLSECYSTGKDGEEVICDWEADGYRLPTEGEWQFACMAGSSGYRYGELDRIAWYHDNSCNEIHEVGKKEPNAWGLYDMLGNAWEWCWDVYDVKKYGEYRIFRGGGWAEEARGCGASCRRRGHPTFRIDDLGFRLARAVYKVL